MSTTANPLRTLLHAHTRRAVSARPDPKLSTGVEEEVPYPMAIAPTDLLEQELHPVAIGNTEGVEDLLEDNWV